MRRCRKFSSGFSALPLLIGALVLLILPLKWIAAALFAALWHELCHYLAVKLCGADIEHIHLGSNGTVMECGALPPGKELLCDLAGPVGGILPLLLIRWLPRTAVCAFFLSSYNLLPIFPLDGGRALRTAAAWLLPPNWSEKICSAAEFGAMLLVMMLAGYAALILRLGFMPILLACILLLRVRREKFLANCRDSGYNSAINATR